MLFDWAKNKKDEAEINNWWHNFEFKNGHKNINVDNFLKLNYTHCSYTINKRYYRGFFTHQEIDNIFKALDYNKGRVRALAG